MIWIKVLYYILGYLAIGFVTATAILGVYGEGYLDHDQMALVIGIWPFITVFIVVYIIFSGLATLSEKLGSEVWHHRRNRNKKDVP